MEESDLIPEGKKPKESLSERSSGQINDESIIDPSKTQSVSNTNNVELIEDINKNSSVKKEYILQNKLSALGSTNSFVSRRSLFKHWS